MRCAFSMRVCMCFLAVLFTSALSVAEEHIGVTVSIPPQKYFAEKIGGRRIAVTVMVPPGADAHVYEPKPKQLVALSRSRLYFGIGLEFERAWLPRFKTANPHLIVVFTDERITKIPMKHHDHPAERQHERGEGLDPHIWLAPPLVKTIAESMYRAIAEADTVHRQEYAANYRVFIAEIDTLDAGLRNVLASTGERVRFMVFHPAWGYFADTYGLEQIPIEIEGREPKPSELIRLIKTAKALNISVIFVQPQVSTRGAQAIADAVGGRTVYANPLAENWAANLRAAAGQFHKAMR